ncbi:MAG: hypothetical protein LC713_01755 [Actinobacteria bacterium]|nr:hypothetical protein [Actinomycetota bacterium]
MTAGPGCTCRYRATTPSSRPPPGGGPRSWVTTGTTGRPAPPAGALITADAALAEHARREQFVRYATLNPMISQLMLTYLLVLVVGQTSAGGGRAPSTAYRWARSRYAAHRVSPVPSWQTCAEISAHLARMSGYFAANLHRLERDASGLLALDEQLYPVAGYSSLPRLSAAATDPREVVTWVNTCGREHHLKLNPAVLFGGDEHAWSSLYPGPRIRLNVSVPAEQLHANLALLRHAAGALDARPRSCEAAHARRT